MSFTNYLQKFITHVASHNLPGVDGAREQANAQFDHEAHMLIERGRVSRKLRIRSSDYRFVFRPNGPDKLALDISYGQLSNKGRELTSTPLGGGATFLKSDIIYALYHPASALCRSETTDEHLDLTPSAYFSLKEYTGGDHLNMSANAAHLCTSVASIVAGAVLAVPLIPLFYVGGRAFVERYYTNLKDETYRIILMNDATLLGMYVAERAEQGSSHIDKQLLIALSLVLSRDPMCKPEVLLSLSAEDLDLLYRHKYVEASRMVEQGRITHYQGCYMDKDLYREDGSQITTRHISLEVQIAQSTHLPTAFRVIQDQQLFPAFWAYLNEPASYADYPVEADFLAKNESKAEQFLKDLEAKSQHSSIYVPSACTPQYVPGSILLDAHVPPHLNANASQP